MPDRPRIVRALGLIAGLCLGGCISAQSPAPVETNEGPYGECADENGRSTCREDEPFCDIYPSAGSPAEFGVCTPVCETDEDCPVPATGSATIACVGEPVGCVLECSAGEVCPDGMECDPSGACRWLL